MEFQGLPLHILVLHLTVVFAPLTAAVAMVYGLVPRARRVLAWPLGVGAFVTMVSGFVTAHFGEELERALKETPDIEAHAAFGDSFKFVALGFAVICFALLLASETALARVNVLRWCTALQRNVALRRTLIVAAVLASLALVVMTYLTGHSGAVAVWRDWRR